MRAIVRITKSTRAVRVARTMTTVAPVVPTELRSFDSSKLSEVREWAQKNYGGLADAKNKPDQSWMLQAVNQASVLACMAEINATEFAFAKLDAKALKAKYQEQLATFDSVRRAQLEKEGVSAVIINHLHDIYKFRAAVPLWELEQAVAELGFLGGRAFRVTRRQLESHPTWRAVKIRTPFNSENFAPAFGDVFMSNEEMAAANVKRFRGMRGAMNAFAKGLSNEQYDHLLRTVEKYSVSPAQHDEIAKRVEEVRALSKAGGSQADAAIQRLFEDYPMGTPQHQHLKELVAADRLSDKVTALSYSESSSSAAVQPAAFKAQVDEAIKKAVAQAPERKKTFEALSQLLGHVTKPEEQKKLRLVNVLASTPLPDKARDELLAPFADQTDNDALLNDVLNAHPLAARLWGNRVAWLATENLDYTKRYEEAHDTGLYRQVTADKIYSDALKAPFFDAPTLGPYPFNTGLEEIHHMKLQDLANVFGFNLSTDLGIAQFDSFVHNYEISPGEQTLERAFSYPPPLHTYDELPIIKFDSFDEADVPEDYEEYAEYVAKHAAKKQH